MMPHPAKVNVGLVEQLTGDIRELRLECIRKRDSYREVLVKIGGMLCRLKDELPHGDFRAYCSRELSIDPRNAAKWMEMYRGRMAPETPKRESSSHLRASGIDARHAGGTRTYVEPESSPGDDMSDEEAAMWLKGDGGDGGGGEGDPCGNTRGSAAPAGVERTEPPLASGPAPLAPPSVPPCGDVKGQLTLEPLFKAAERVRQTARLIEAGRLGQADFDALMLIVDRVLAEGVRP